MRNMIIFIVFIVLIALPCAAAVIPQNLGSLVQFKMDGDNLSSADLIIPASPWDTPTIASTHSGEGNTCITGPGCWSRYLNNGTFVFDVTKDDVSIGTITLNGYWFATTKNAPSAIFNYDADIHTMQMWGDFNVDVNYEGDVIQGDFIGIMEYWNPEKSPGYQVLDMLDVNDVLPYDVLRFRINMTRGLPGNEIIVTDKKEIGLDNLVEHSENIVQVSKNGEEWGQMNFSNHAEAFDELIGKPGFKNQSTYITRLRMENLTDYWIVEGWAKTFFVNDTQKYRTVMTAGMVVDQGKTGIVDNDGDGVWSNEDCDDNNGTVWQLLTGYADNDDDSYTLADPEKVCSGDSLLSGYLDSPSTVTDCDDDNIEVWEQITGYGDFDGDTYTSGSEEFCTDGTLPSGYLAEQNPDDCDDHDNSVNPGETEICGNAVDEDCALGLDNGCGSVNGIVYSTLNWSTVYGISVQLIDTETEQTYYANSAEDGYYEFTVPVGIYNISASGECYMYPSILYPSFELGLISVTDGSTNSNNYVYVDYTCGVE